VGKLASLPLGCRRQSHAFSFHTVCLTRRRRPHTHTHTLENSAQCKWLTVVCYLSTQQSNLDLVPAPRLLQSRHHDQGLLAPGLAGLHAHTRSCMRFGIFQSRRDWCELCRRHLWAACHTACKLQWACRGCPHQHDQRDDDDDARTRDCARGGHGGWSEGKCCCWSWGRCVFILRRPNGV
jgi:hypothetical protein